MKQINSYTLACKTLFLVLAIFVLSAPAYSQGINFQQMPASGWSATPVFFAATNDEERKRAILTWLESSKYESWEANQRRFGVYPADRMEAIREHAVPWFTPIFGKPFPELSKKEKEQIARWLKKCSPETWVEYGLIQPLTQPENSPQMSEWNQAFRTPRPTPWALRRLGAPNLTLKLSKARAEIYNQSNDLLRIEFLVSVSGWNQKGNTTETTKTGAALLVVSESGQVVRQDVRETSVVVWYSDAPRSGQAPSSLLLETRGNKEKLFMFLNELSCRWGATDRVVRWMETCAEAGGYSRGRTIHLAAREFIEKDLPQLPRFPVAVGQEVEHAGWKGIRIR
ncbi:MAG: hypothetical protein ACKV2V_18055 [Blastocatellia bacterium]